METTTVVTQTPDEDESSSENGMIASQEIGVQLGVLRQEILNNRPDLTPMMDQMTRLSQNQDSLLTQLSELRNQVGQLEVESDSPMEVDETAVVVDTPPIQTEETPTPAPTAAKRKGLARVFLGE